MNRGKKNVLIPKEITGVEMSPRGSKMIQYSTKVAKHTAKISKYTFEMVTFMLKVAKHVPKMAKYAVDVGKRVVAFVALTSFSESSRVFDLLGAFVDAALSIFQ